MLHIFYFWMYPTFQVFIGFHLLLYGVKINYQTSLSREIHHSERLRFVLFLSMTLHYYSNITSLKRKLIWFEKSAMLEKYVQIYTYSSNFQKFANRFSFCMKMYGSQKMSEIVGKMPSNF